MKRYAFTETHLLHKQVSKGGRFYRVVEIPDTARVSAVTVEAETLEEAITAFHTIPVPVPPKLPRTLTKRELVDKLIEAGIAAKFNDLLGTLPLEEKLRWEASPTISPDYPYIRDNRATICSKLGITAEQLDNIFR